MPVVVSNPPTIEQIESVVQTTLSKAKEEEAKVKAEASKVWSWIKANIAHVPTYAALAWAFFKHVL